MACGIFYESITSMCFPVISPDKDRNQYHARPAISPIVFFF